MVDSNLDSNEISGENNRTQFEKEKHKNRIKTVRSAIQYLHIHLEQSYAAMSKFADLSESTLSKMFAKNTTKSQTKTLVDLEKIAYMPYSWIESSDGRNDDEARADFKKCIQKKLDGKLLETDDGVWITNVSKFVEFYWIEIKERLPNDFSQFINLRNKASQIIEQRSFIQPFGMQYGAKIEKIYQEVPVLHYYQQQKEEEITVEVTKRIANKLCSSNPTKLIITGELGSGKTTMLLRIAKRIIKETDYLPIFFRFRIYAAAFNKERNSSIIDFIVEDYFEKELENDFIENLRLGKIIIMIDGLDEVPHDEEFFLAFSTLTQFIQKFHNTKFVVSCRNQESWQNKNDQDWLNTFDQVIKLVELKEDTSVKFISGFSKNFKIEYTDSEIKKIRNSLEYLLKTNPLILTFFCVSIISHKNDSNFDNYLDSLQMNKWNLIERCIYIILEEWNQSQDKDSIFWNLSFESKQLYLGNLALKVQETDEFYFTWKRLREFTCDFFASSPNLNPITNIKDNFLVSDKIIDDLEQQQSLFVKKTDTQYGFTNEFIRLWFAATTIKKKYDTLDVYLSCSSIGEEKDSPSELNRVYYEIYPDEVSTT